MKTAWECGFIVWHADCNLRASTARRPAMNYRRSTRAQQQRLVFLAVYVVLSTIATWSASSKHSIGNEAAPKVTATALARIAS
jgi:hypothetical protein